MRTRAIIVGTDGTDCGKAAVEWAAGEARRRGLSLRIVHTFEWEWSGARYNVGGEYHDIARGLAEAITATAVDQARAVAPGIEVEGDTLIGSPAPRLLSLADAAELMVVGSRGRGGFAGLLLGSVSRRVATHASCAVVVVRGRDDADEGPVAVGVDDSPSAEQVLETAFEAASRRACGLAVIRSYLPVVPVWLADVRAAEVETPEQDEMERTRLDEQLAPWRDKFPDVPVEVTLTHASAAAALVDASTRARLVVVGSRGHGVIAGTLLGSAGLQALHHADCPVQVVR
jgi:nucleotide-binding universal stress UspA family protein